MLIISYGKKDYYDYVSGINGIDKLIVYDRKNSVSFNSSRTYNIPTFITRVFFDEKRFPDAKKRACRYKWQINSFYNIKDFKRGKTLYEGDIISFCVEIGKKAYLYECERWLDDNDKVNRDIRLIRVEELKEKYAKEPLAIYECSMSNKCPTWGPRGEIVENPILMNTDIPKLISAEEIWRELYAYIGSLRDKPIVDNRTDKEHIESNGFDVKTSFRNIK